MPRTFVAESVVIDASPDRVFSVVSDFATWTKWSPWLCAEPEATVEVTPDSTSVGSGYKWSGEVVGEGELEHLRLVTNERIEIDLRFLKPWKSRADVYFDFEPAGDGTKLTWTMEGSLPWFMFWMKSMMENMIGMDYRRGLIMLKELIETDQILSKTNVKGVTTVGPVHMVGVKKTCALDQMGEVMGAAMEETDAKLKESTASHEGVRMAVYHSADFKARTFTFTAGVMLQDPSATVSGLSSWSLPESRAFAVEHVGSYANLGNAWSAAHQHVRYKKLKQLQRVGSFEIYRNDPEGTPAGELITDIFLPLK